MRLFAKACVLVSSLVISGAGFAGNSGAKYRITVTNLSPTQVITPPLIAVHHSQQKLFTTGAAASESLALMAEGGDIGPLKGELDSTRNIRTRAASGVLPPGQSFSTVVKTNRGNRFLSMVAMLAGTNDAFVGIDRLDLRRISLKQVYPQVFDAGSEANTENCADIPGPPCGNGSNNRATEGAEGIIHLHPGIQGDGDVGRRYGWASGVVQVTIKRLR